MTLICKLHVHTCSIVQKSCAPHVFIFCFESLLVQKFSGCQTILFWAYLSRLNKINWNKCFYCNRLQTKIWRNEESQVLCIIFLSVFPLQNIKKKDAAASVRSRPGGSGLLPPPPGSKVGVHPPAVTLQTHQSPLALPQTNTGTPALSEFSADQIQTPAKSSHTLLRACGGVQWSLLDF